MKMIVFATDAKELTIWIFIRYFFNCAADEPSEGIVKLAVKGDVDERVDHSMRICKHVDPELIFYQPSR